MTYNILCESRTFSVNEYHLMDYERLNPNVLCMVPVADLFNHGYKDEWNLMYTYDYKNKMFLMQACKDIKRGEQILVSYRDDDEPHNTTN